MKQIKSGRWNKGHHRMHAMHKDNGTCICPNCGYSKPHTPGIPCRAEQCPSCHLPLTRNGEVNRESDKYNENNSHQVKSKKFDFPKVNPDICTGCGICIDNCPTEAIELANGVAFIDEKKCSNCRLCENECPLEAIS